MIVLLLGILISSSSGALIHLRSGSFDPLNSKIGRKLNIQSSMNHWNESEKRILLAHWNSSSPMTESFVNRAISFDNGPLIYIPSQSFIFYGNLSNAREISALENVVWVGELAAKHKIHPSLIVGEVKEKKECRIDAGWEKDEIVVKEIELVVNLYPAREDYDFEGIQRKWLESVGEKANLVRIQVEGKSRLSVFILDDCVADDFIGYLTNLPYVLDLEKKLEYKPFMKSLKPYVINGLTTTEEVNQFYAAGTELLTEAKALTGSSQIIGMADTGVNSHCLLGDGARVSSFLPYKENPQASDLATSGNLKVRYYVQGTGADTADVNSPNHGTIIASILAGKAPDNFATAEISKYNGIAPDAKLFVLDLLGSGSAKMFIPNNLTSGFLRWPYLAGARIYVNSWGAFNPNIYSNVNKIIGEGYNSIAYDFDLFTRNNLDFLSVVPAGYKACPSSISTSEISTLAFSKNAIAVGSSYNLIGEIENLNSSGYLQGLPAGAYLDAAGSAKISSIWTVDGTSLLGSPLNRKKPDVYAPGSFVTGANSLTSAGTAVTPSPSTCSADIDQGLQIDYEFQGSSIAAGVVGGLLAIIRDYYVKGWYSAENTGRPDTKAGFQPSASLVKATIIHGAVMPPNSTSVYRYASVLNGPSNCFPNRAEDLTQNKEKFLGFGFVRLNNSIRFKDYAKKIYLPGFNKNNSLTFGDPFFTTQGQNHTYYFCAQHQISIEEIAPKITLVWTDPPGSILSGGALVNNLDLKVLYADKIYYGNGGSSADNVNNVEQVKDLPIPTVEQDRKLQLTVIVSATTLFADSSVQSYSLIVSGSLLQGTCEQNQVIIEGLNDGFSLNAKFWGLAVWIWIIIGSGVFCLGGCGVFVFCCSAFVKRNFFPQAKSENTAQSTHVSSKNLELGHVQSGADVSPTDSYVLTPSTPKSKKKSRPQF